MTGISVVVSTEAIIECLIMRERREGSNKSGNSDWRVCKRLVSGGVSLEVRKPSSLSTES